jgi:desulfoferrodoxin (superoxide reductase-like protein)
MPTISMFYGILIRMFFRDIEKHHVPHIHADYQGQVAVYSIIDGSVLVGELPPKKHKLVVAWIEIHQEDLLADWELAVNGQKPFLIRGLDQ